MIRAVRVGTIGTRYWGTRAGRLHALLPEPADYDCLVSGLVSALASGVGEPSVVAPHRSPRPPSLSWWDRLALVRRVARIQNAVNPDQHAPAAALVSASRSDSQLEYALVMFGPSLAETGAAMFSADGRPILWIWLHEDVHTVGWEMIEAVTRDWQRSELELEWEKLLPARPRLALELHRAALHRGDSGSWTDGSRSLGFAAGLGVKPQVVYLPPESEWAASAPAWAATLRSTIVRDFEWLGARVVASPGAPVYDVRRAE